MAIMTVVRMPGALPKDIVAQTEDVLMDTRGYVYITDKNWGVWILRYRGPDQPAPIDRRRSLVRPRNTELHSLFQLFLHPRCPEQGRSVFVDAPLASSAL